MKLETGNEITWCPGCTNYLVKTTVQNAIKELISEGKAKKEDFVSVVDIGCSSKMYDYLNISGINGLHGRTLPIALGVKIGNPNLHVLGFAGDGGTYNEGIERLIHNCRYNSDFTMFVMNNQIFALTVGQATSVTEEGFVEKTTPFGVKEKPLNPIALVLEAGATFVARLNVFDLKENIEIIKKAILHKGFAFVEFLQPCLKFHNHSDYLRQNSYKISPMNKEDALKKAREWNYEYEGKIPAGIFYDKEEKSFEEKREILNKLLKEKKGFGDLKEERKILKDFLN